MPKWSGRMASPPAPEGQSRRVLGRSRISPSVRTDFPGANAAPNQPKKGVGFRTRHISERAGQRRTPAAELCPQVSPLVVELPDGLGNPHSGARTAELSAVEGEAAALRLGVNVKEIAVDEGQGAPLGLKAAKLGMMAVSARAAEKDLASEERFPPERGQALGIEVARMNRPESHEALLFTPGVSASYRMSAPRSARSARRTER